MPLRFKPQHTLKALCHFENDSHNCRLCLKEATAVVYALKDKTYLNKRNEFVSS